MKKYVVRLTDEELRICEETMARLPGSSQNGRGARTRIPATLASAASPPSVP